MKILFVNLPYHGHVVPTIGLVRELIQMGCRVSYLMPYGWETRIAGSWPNRSKMPTPRQTVFWTISIFLFMNSFSFWEKRLPKSMASRLSGSLPPLPQIMR